MTSGTGDNVAQPVRPGTLAPRRSTPELAQRAIATLQRAVDIGVVLGSLAVPAGTSTKTLKGTRLISWRKTAHRTEFRGGKPYCLVIPPPL